MGLFWMSQATLSFHSMLLYSLSKVLKTIPLIFFLGHGKPHWTPPNLFQPMFSEHVAQCLTYNRYRRNICEITDLFPSPTPPEVPSGIGNVILANGARGHLYLI